MENFKANNKRPSYGHVQNSFQEYDPNGYSGTFKIARQLQFSAFNEKDPFFRYASSVLQIQTEEEQKNINDHVYEQSQLINPPESLIKKYESMKQQQRQKEIITSRSFQKKLLNLKIIEKGIQKLVNFILSFQHKKQNQNLNKIPQSLIDILAHSFVEHTNIKDEKSQIKDFFLKLKMISLANADKIKYSKPKLPIDKKRNNLLIQKKDQKSTLTCTLLLNKKEGTEHLIGVLAFKVLLIQSEIFASIKNVIKSNKIQQFINKINKITILTSFQNIFTFSQTQNLRIDSKILSLSKSKSKKSLSKLKIHNYVSNSQKKIISIRKYPSQQTQSNSEDNFKQKYINSEIIEDFDIQCFKYKEGNDNESNQKKIAFNNKIKKKNTRDSMSQAQTVNSKRSFQSEYQFAQGVNSKISSYQKPNSAKNYTGWDEDSNQFAIEEIPTQKMINIKKNKSRQNLEYKKILFPQINFQCMPLKMFRLQQRRYLNVRTNLFQLPIYSQKLFKQSLKNYKNKDQMGKIYHQIPDGIQNHYTFEDQADNLTIKPLNIIPSEEIRQSNSVKSPKNYKQMIQTQERKKKTKNQKEKEKDRLENYYFKADETKSKQNSISTNQLNFESILQNKAPQENKMIKKNISEPYLQSLSIKQNQRKSVNDNLIFQSFHPQATQTLRLKQKKSHKLKIKKTDNYQQYYFNRELNKNIKNQTNYYTERNQSQKSKFIRPVIKNYHTCSGDINNIQNTKSNYQAEYATQKSNKIMNPSSTSISKNMKSMSPSAKFITKGHYKTGQPGNLIINSQPGNVIINQQQKFNSPSNAINNRQSKIFSTNSSNIKFIHQLPAEMQISQMNTPKNIHNLGSVMMETPGFIISSQNRSKLKNSSQSPRPLSPKQSNLINHLFPSQSSSIKNSFIINSNARVINRPPSNLNCNNQNSMFTPTNSNLSNQPSINNLNRVINFGPNPNSSQQMFARQSSILSTHSNQSKQKIIVSKPGQIIKIAQRNPHMISRPQMMFQHSPKFANRQIFQQHQRSNEHNSINSGRRGLNVMMNDPHRIVVQRPSPNNSINKQYSTMTRQKSNSNQKIFITIRK